MACCEKCWGDAYYRYLTTGKDQDVCYHELLLERADNPCTPRDQAGDWWDEENQCDRRTLKRETRQQKLFNPISESKA